VGENETNILFGRPGRRWKDNIKMYRVEIGWGIVWLGKGKSVGRS